MTIGHLVRAIMQIHKPEDARQFYEEYVEYLKTCPDLDHRGPEYVARMNIGWCFGEGMAEADRAMWREVCAARHPAFGTMESNPSTQEAFDAGLRAGQK